jgi:uncharacterized hydrophobic protein (TIGR00271 family)
MSETRDDGTNVGWLQSTVGFPRMGRDERLELQGRLEEGARSDWDYLMMMALAAVLASLGLLQGSTAVVIGAMLVAPLMGPLVAAGLALVQGNAQLFRTGIRSTAIGIGVGFVVSLLTGAINPGYEPSLEVEARGDPDLLDLVIALASGMAAAYATGRPKVAGTLAGVAIAAALVPPLAVVGIALTNERLFIGAYASILLLTNLVAIILGAALTFALLGVRVQREGHPTRVWVRQALAALVAGGILLSAPLLMNVLEKRRVGQARPLTYPVAPRVRAAVHEYLAEWPELEVLRMSRSSVEPEAAAHIVVLSPGELAPEVEAGLVRTVHEARGDEAPVSVFPVLSARSRGERDAAERGHARPFTRTDSVPDSVPPSCSDPPKPSLERNPAPT